MYGYDYALLREREHSLRRTASVPVMAAHTIDDWKSEERESKRARSMTQDGMERAWLQAKQDQQTVGRLSFGDLAALDLGRGTEPLLSPRIPEGEKGSTWRPVLLTLCVGMGALLFGINIGFSSPTETQIRNQAGLNKSQSDFMFSLVTIGAVFGCLGAGKISEIIGRKKSLIFTAVPFTIGVLLFYFSLQYWVLCLARMVSGFGVGLVSVLVPLYIAETSPVHLRGSLGTANQFLIASGIVVVNAIGVPIVENNQWWKTMLLLSLIPVALLAIPMLLIGPETPHWLMRNGHQKEAEKALRQIRGRNYNVKQELADISQAGGQDEDDDLYDDELVTVSKPAVSKLKYLLTKGFRPFMIGISLQLLQQWSGINAIMFHTTSLFVTTPAGQDPSKPDQYKALVGAIAVNGVQVLMAGVAVVLMNKAGRKVFLTLSCLGMAASGALVGIAYSQTWSQEAIIGLVMFFLASFSIGVGPLPWLLCSELFPSYCRELAMSLATVVNWASAFGVTASNSAFEEAITPSGVFYFYAVVAFAGAIFVNMFVPETRGKSLQEIEQMFIIDDELY